MTVTADRAKCGKMIIGIATETMANVAAVPVARKIILETAGIGNLYMVTSGERGLSYPIYLGEPNSFLPELAEERRDDTLWNPLYNTGRVELPRANTPVLPRNIWLIERPRQRDEIIKIIL